MNVAGPVKLLTAIQIHGIITLKSNVMQGTEGVDNIVNPLKNSTIL